MPQRASNRDIGSNVGRMVFHGQGSHSIKRALGSVDQGKMKDALSRRGLGSMSHEELAKVLSGEHRAGLDQAKLRGVVEVLQDVGLARKARSASQMVLQASKDAQAAANPGLSREAVKARMKGLAVERREEANAEETAAAESPMSVLDRMRGAMGRANKKADASSQPMQAQESEGRTVRQIRESMREDLKLRPALIPPKKPPFES